MSFYVSFICSIFTSSSSFSYQMNALHESDQYRVYRCIDSVIILHFLENGLGFVSTHSDWSINITNQVSLGLTTLSPPLSYSFMSQTNASLALSHRIEPIKYLAPTFHKLITMTNKPFTSTRKKINVVTC